MFTVSGVIFVRKFSSGTPSMGLFKNIKKTINDRRKPVVSIINLYGVIMPPSSSSQFGSRSKVLNIDTSRNLIDKAFAPEKLEAVLLNVNSPGGYPAQCELISNYIKLKASKKSVPITAFVEDQAVSGGYWLACLGEKIFCTRTSLVGSIGVLYSSFGFTELMGKAGIERRVHTAGKSKAILDPFQPTKSEDIKIMTQTLEDIHTQFKSHVKASRGNRIGPEVEERLFSGEFWVGERSLDLGLVDGIDDPDSFVERNYGDRVRVVRIKAPGNPFQQLFQSRGLADSILETQGLAEDWARLYQLQHPGNSIFKKS